MDNIGKVQVVEVLNTLLKTKRVSDNYVDGVLDMYNAVVKLMDLK